MNFHVSATAHETPSSTIAEYVWTFDDGDYAFDPDNHPLMTDFTKVFKAPLHLVPPYQVHVTAIDDKGKRWLLLPSP